MDPVPSSNTPPEEPRRASEASLGLVAVLGVVLCCALPALISGGVAATVARWLGQPLAIVAGLALVAAAVGYLVRRRRSRCRPEHPAGPGTTAGTR